ncbi:MAG TPA: hypothetical protein VMR08_02100 [Patescibacteria group bacterium]|jgi:hypothetical protein|nr:hypothetical protein [Patescibacteria group bacterium]
MFGQQDDQTTTDQSVPPTTNISDNGTKPDGFMPGQTLPSLSHADLPEAEPPAIAPGNSPVNPSPSFASFTAPTPTASSSNIFPSEMAINQPDSTQQSPVAQDDLLDLKTKALQELVPLVDQLEQTPEEKFKTTLMMIQASDNQSLIQTAYETAQKITDNKERAQALLDLVNEINYFTQVKNKS